ncbi:hypothetical protein ABEV55_12565 [Aneurinibacillus thermoaerophilus]|uniref:hypothetical protein n=1 Tax=Aneurinibacillus thermoaerophilus TaxID=143495 RepID=UPI002E1F51FE|nr:hypothetical protein [Aneurinibacillus thermoaerophilus]
MSNLSCKFDGREFASLEKMVEILLHEASEQMALIDGGKKKNSHQERAYAKWRLVHLQHCFGEYVPEQYRSTYNSLWSQLYRLEHQSNYRHPYIVYLLEKALAQEHSHIK